MKKEYIIALILAYLGIFFMFIGAIFKVIELNQEVGELNKIVTDQGNEIIKLKEENEHLWSNYYMNVSEYEGEYYE